MDGFVATATLFGCECGGDSGSGWLYGRCSGSVGVHCPLNLRSVHLSALAYLLTLLERLEHPEELGAQARRGREVGVSVGRGARIGVSVA